MYYANNIAENCRLLVLLLRRKQNKSGNIHISDLVNECFFEYDALTRPVEQTHKIKTS